MILQLRTKFPDLKARVRQALLIPLGLLQPLQLLSLFVLEIAIEFDLSGQDGFIFVKHSFGQTCSLEIDLYRRCLIRYVLDIHGFAQILNLDLTLVVFLNCLGIKFANWLRGCKVCSFCLLHRLFLDQRRLSLDRTLFGR